jgi:hypothetical protein
MAGHDAVTAARTSAHVLPGGTEIDHEGLIAPT